MPEQNLTYRIAAKDDGAIANSAKVRDALIKDSKRVKAENEGSGLHARVEELKGSFGRGSALHEVSEIFRGAGPLIGIAAAVEGVKSLSEGLIKVRELSEQGAGTGEIAIGLMKSIPVLAQIADAGQFIREFFTGEQAEITRINELSKLTGEAMDQWRAGLSRVRLEYMGIAEAHEKSLNVQALIGTSGAALEQGQLRQALTMARGNIAAARGDEGGAPVALQTEIDAIRKRYEPELNKLREEHGSAQTAAYSLGRDREANESVDRALGFSGKRAPIPAEAHAIEKANETRKMLDIGMTTQNQEIKAARDKYLGEQQDAADEANAKLLESQRKYDGALLKLNEDVAQQIAGSRVKANQDLLRLNGEFYDADISQLKMSFDAQNRTVEESFAKRIDTIRQDLQAGTIDLKGAAGQAGGAFGQFATMLGLNAQALGGGEATAGRTESNRAADVQGQVAKARLSALGDEVAANNHLVDADQKRLEIAGQFADRKRELQELLEKANATEREGIQAQIAGLDASEKKVQAQALNNMLQDAATGGLERLASAGDRRAGIDLAQFRIKKQFAEETARLTGIAGDNSASAEQRAAASQLLGTLGSQQAAALGAAARQGLTISPFAGVENSQGAGSAIGGRAQKQAFFRQHGSEDPNLSESRKQTEILDKMLAALIAPPPNALKR